MTNAPRPQSTASPAARDANTVAVISAYGAFRVLLVMLTLWTYFEGFALLTGGLSALSFGGGDRTAERVVGAQMIVFVPAYAMLAWRRDEYRLMIWMPYAAQLAVIIPTAWALLRGDYLGLLMLVVSLTFFVLLFYFWWHSHPLDYFVQTEEDGDDEIDEGDGEDDGEEGDESDDEEDDGEPASGPSVARPRTRAREVVKRPGKFRRR
jgi:hypothetical protein